jgi:DNA-binding phage protein
MEDETGVSMQDMIEQKPTDVINSQQRTRMGNVAANAGMTTQQFGKWLSAEGYPKSSQITVKQFDEIIEKLQKIAKGE